MHLEGSAIVEGNEEDLGLDAVIVNSEHLVPGVLASSDDRVVSVVVFRTPSPGHVESLP